MVYKNLSELIGKTPLVYLANFNSKHNTKIAAKLEYFNPAGSIKDRVSFSMIADAEKSGLLKKDTVIIEPTSGNTGIGLAMIAAIKGYKLILVMPETMSIERRKLLAAYGAEIVLTGGPEGMSGSIKKAGELANLYPNSFIPNQFSNPANPKAHEKTTGPEIWKDTNGQIDIFVAGVGTGGTLSGAGKFLKDKNPNIKNIAVEPLDSPVLSQGKNGPHQIQGIGAGFIPDNLNIKIYDEVIAVSNEDAINCAKEIAKTDGILVGISSGAALYAAKTVSIKKENAGKAVVVIFPDTGERYLSTALFDADK